MEATRFDRWTRLFPTSTSRRQALLALLLTGTMLGPWADAGAKRKKKGGGSSPCLAGQHSVACGGPNINCTTSTGSVNGFATRLRVMPRTVMMAHRLAARTVASVQETPTAKAFAVHRPLVFSVPDAQIPATPHASAQVHVASHDGPEPLLAVDLPFPFRQSQLLILCFRERQTGPRDAPFDLRIIEDSKQWQQGQLVEPVTRSPRRTSTAYG
jgi:hypothetical protein